MRPSPLGALRQSGLYGLLPPLVAISFVSNLSVLVVPLFMMQVFDRVVGTGNLNTLALLVVAAVLCLAGVAGAEVFRDRALARAGHWLRLRIETQAYSGGPVDRSLAEAALSYVANGGLTTALSLIWLPLFLAVLAALHPALVVVALAFGAALVALGEGQRRLQTPPMAEGLRLRNAAQDYADTLRDAGRLPATMGIGTNILARRNLILSDAGTAEWRASRQRGDLASLLNLLRALAQISMLSTGAILLVDHLITPGGTIAATLLGAKVLGSIESTARGIGDTRSFLRAMAAWDQAVADRPADIRTDISDLSGALGAENVTVPRSPGAPPRLDRVSFQLRPGECLAILGESGSGKTTLIEALAGIAPPPIGSVRLDQTDIRTLPRDRFASIAGYLPQGATLLHGTIADNIARWSPTRDDASIIAAARDAGVHAFISSLPDAYETRLPDAAHLISPGQAQRIALARAWYGRPGFLFLDEPNALLDPAGERLMQEALARMKRDGCTIVMSLHRGGAIGLADRILVLDRGRISDFGPRREVLERLEGGARHIHLLPTDAAADDLTDWVRSQFRRAEDAALRQKSIIAARELFAFARANGSDSRTRRLTVTFRFLDDMSCVLTLTEARRTRLEAKVNAVRARLSDPSLSPESLPSDEAALARVLSIVQRFEVHSAERASSLIATLNTGPTGPSSEGFMH